MTRSLVTIVVPCFNEEETIPMLREVLERLLARLAERYEVELLFVDDGSRDRTRELLEKVAPALRRSSTLSIAAERLARAIRPLV